MNEAEYSPRLACCASRRQVLFLVKRPYADKGVRQVGFVASLLLVLFLLFGLLIKASVVISRRSNTFYAVCVGIITCATFTLPPLIVVRRWMHADIAKTEAWMSSIISAPGNGGSNGSPPAAPVPVPTRRRGW